jgi:hypothetical protein
MFEATTNFMEPRLICQALTVMMTLLMVLTTLVKLATARPSRANESRNAETHPR